MQDQIDTTFALVYTPHQMSTIELVTNQTLAILTVATQVASILLFIGLFGTLKPLRHFVHTFVARFALWGAFALTAGAVVGSLLYSEVIGFDPCILCWWQRIFMYPLVLITGIGAFRGDRTAALYGIPLATLGALIALYHYLLQNNAAPALACSVESFAVSCSQTQILLYGYITIPMMALSVFVLAILLLILAYRSKK